MSDPAPLKNFKSYLGSCDLSEHLKLTKELSFHWANWDKTCLEQRKIYKNFNNNFHLIRLNQNLLELKTKQVWLCNKIKTVKSDLYSLYESYLDNRLRLTWFERKDEILFSFESEQGPFYTLTSMKWLDTDIYSQFVLRKILLEQYTLRSFRLNATIPITFKMDSDFKVYKEKVKIHQLSEAGFIFKINDKNFINKIKNSQMLELIIPVNPYQDVSSMNIEVAFQKLNEDLDYSSSENKLFMLEAKILNFYGNMNNAKRSTDEEFFIFARYEDLVPRGHDLNLKKIFAPLVEKTKIHFLNTLEELEKHKTWHKTA